MRWNDSFFCFHYWVQVAFDDSRAKVAQRLLVSPTNGSSCSVHAVVGQGAEEAGTATQAVAAFLSSQLGSPVADVVADYIRDASGTLCLIQVRHRGICTVCS